MPVKPKPDNLKAKRLAGITVPVYMWDWIMENGASRLVQDLVREAMAKEREEVNPVLLGSLETGQKFSHAQGATVYEVTERDEMFVYFERKPTGFGRMFPSSLVYPVDEESKL